MSKQRYILTILLLAGTLLGGQIHIQNHSQLWFGANGSSMDILLNDRLYLSYNVSKQVQWELENDLLRRDFRSEDQYMRVYNSMGTFASYSSTGTLAKLGYRNTLYGDATRMGLYPQTQPMRVYDKEMQNTAYLVYGQKLGRFSLRGEAMLKALSVQPWDYEWDLESFELVENRKPKDTLWDSGAGAQLEYNPMDGIKVYGAYLYS
ncbi:MAG: hypothetical protein U1C33_08175, partial [Candidatus Cloacimonadaceae bacterium]|nr:hypothetical protein [Candidatus Cloacimonadaceae bacterium]